MARAAEQRPSIRSYRSWVANETMEDYALRYGECPAFCVRDCRSMLRGKDSVDHGEEDRRLDTGRAAEGLRAA